MRILDLDTIVEAEVVRQAAGALSSGGMIIYPTETTYGLGVDATNQQAVDKLLKFKGQRGLKPISIAVADQKMAQQHVELNSVAKNLYKKFLPGPLTIVSHLISNSPDPSCPALSHGIASIDKTVGIRIPNSSLVMQIIEQFGKPITATSANISGARHPWSLRDVQKTTPEKKLKLVDLFLDAGELPNRRPSTIVNTANERTEIVREGELEISNFKFQISNSSVKTHTSSSEEETKKIAENILKQNTSSPLVIALQGPLGAGKTVFAKGIAEALGITEPIRSPSYQLVREYKTPEFQISNFKFQILYHIDAWRLSSKEEFVDLGLDRMVKDGNIIVVEWPRRIASMFPKLQEKTAVVFVDIAIVDEHKRRIQISK